MKKTLMTMVVTAIISLSLYAANMASQPWVDMRIAQQETNTQVVVDLKLSTSTSVVTTVWVESRINDLRQEIYRGIASAEEILSNTNDPDAIEKAYHKEIESAMPLANYLIDFAIQF